MGVALAALQSGPGRVQVFPTSVGVARILHCRSGRCIGFSPHTVGVARLVGQNNGNGENVIPTYVGVNRNPDSRRENLHVVFPTHSGGEPENGGQLLPPFSLSALFGPGRLVWVGDSTLLLPPERQALKGISTVKLGLKTVFFKLTYLIQESNRLLILQFL